MSLDKRQSRPQGVNHLLLLMYALFVLFVGLKLTGEIAWSWWLVFAPLWGYALTLLTVGFIAGFVGAYRAVRRRKDKAESV